MAALFDVDLIFLPSDEGGVFDIQFDSEGDIKTKDGFDAAIITSLYTNQRADSSEVPDPRMRQGWAGNELNPDGFELGSKLWLYKQQRRTPTVVAKIEVAAQESLQWFVTDGLLDSITAKAVLTATGVDLTVTMVRFNSQVDHRHFTLWDGTGT